MRIKALARIRARKQARVETRVRARSKEEAQELVLVEARPRANALAEAEAQGRESARAREKKLLPMRELVTMIPKCHRNRFYFAEVSRPRSLTPRNMTKSGINPRHPRS